MGVALMGGPALGGSSDPASAAQPSSDPADHAGHTMSSSTTALWSSELIERRLAAAGIGARLLPPAGPHIFMSMPARTYELPDGDELQVYVYPERT